MVSCDGPDVKLISVEDLLNAQSKLVCDEIVIPPYQRDYKWGSTHVRSLLDDICEAQEEALKDGNENQEYWLGTMIFHVEKENKITNINIVDGQQRYITLAATIFVLEERLRENGLAAEVKPIGNGFKVYSDWKSAENVWAAVRTIVGWINEKQEEGSKNFSEQLVQFYRYILENCRLAAVFLTDISEAFQFFSTQNDRGKKLETHDLLKAFHLREIRMTEDSDDLDTMQKCAQWWQSIETDLLENRLKSIYLVHQWLKGRKTGAGTIWSVTVPLEFFKGIRIGGKADDLAPYASPYKLLRDITHSDGKKFPFQLDQPVLNGKLFFEMLRHYSRYLPRQVFDQLVYSPVADWEGNATAEVVEFMFTDYFQDVWKFVACRDIHRCRTGDYYCRLLFHLAVMTYQDRFGDINFKKALEIIYLWSFRVRVKKPKVTFQMVEEMASGGGSNNLTTELATGFFYGRGPGLLELIATSVNSKAFLNSVVRNKLILREQELKEGSYPDYFKKFNNSL
jgi:hypothetical protein